MKKRIVIFVALLAFALGFVVAFYTRFEMLSNKLEADGFRGGAANAVKHAYAASQVYDGLRFLHVTPHAALQTVVYLGYANEYAEKLTKYFKPDPDNEVKKDLYNNFAGIMAARWHENHDTDQPVFSTLLDLTKKEILVTQRDNLPFEGSADPFAWFDEHHVDIQQRVESALTVE